MARSESSPAPALPIDAIGNTRLRKRLLTLGSQVSVINRQIADLESAKKALMSEIEQLDIDNLGVTRIAGMGWDLMKVPGGRSDIRAERLLEKGVKMTVIEYATVKTTWEKWQVRNQKADKAD